MGEALLRNKIKSALYDSFVMPLDSNTLHFISRKLLYSKSQVNIIHLFLLLSFMAFVCFIFSSYNMQYLWNKQNYKRWIKWIRACTKDTRILIKLSAHTTGSKRSWALTLGLSRNIQMSFNAYFIVILYSMRNWWNEFKWNINKNGTCI